MPIDLTIAERAQSDVDEWPRLAQAIIGKSAVTINDGVARVMSYLLEAEDSLRRAQSEAEALVARLDEVNVNGRAIRCAEELERDISLMFGQDPTIEGARELCEYLLCWVSAEGVGQVPMRPPAAVGGGS